MWQKCGGKMNVSCHEYLQWLKKMLKKRRKQFFYLFLQISQTYAPKRRNPIVTLCHKTSHV